MKRSHLILLSLLPMITLLVLPLITFAQNTGNTKIVVLDAGHGGIDPGAVGYANEAEVTLSVAEKVKVLLEARGINVVMTRQDDSYVELEQRVKFANPETSLFLSIHAMTAPNPNASGIGTWVYNGDNHYSYGVEVGDDSVIVYIDSEKETAQDLTNSLESLELSLAQNLQTALVNTTGAKDRGTREETFYTLRNVPVPSIMIDIGFVSNAEEGAKLSTDAYQQILAEAIAKTLTAYLE